VEGLRVRVVDSGLVLGILKGSPADVQWGWIVSDDYRCAEKFLLNLMLVRTSSWFRVAEMD
jgi:hypothetical protein